MKGFYVWTMDNQGIVKLRFARTHEDAVERYHEMFRSTHNVRNPEGTPNVKEVA